MTTSGILIKFRANFNFKNVFPFFSQLYSNHQNPTSAISISSSNSLTLAPIASTSVASVTTNGCAESVPPVKKLRRET